MCFNSMHCDMVEKHARNLIVDQVSALTWSSEWGLGQPNQLGRRNKHSEIIAEASHQQAFD